MIYIYAMKCSACTKQYIGISNNPRKRLKSHLAAETLKWHQLTKFGRAVKRYGAKTFTMRILEQTEDPQEAILLETKWIKRLGKKRLWNSNFGGAYSGANQRKYKPFIRKTKDEARRED